MCHIYSNLYIFAFGEVERGFMSGGKYVHVQRTEWDASSFLRRSLAVDAVEESYISIVDLNKDQWIR